MMCSDNKGEITETTFSAGCHRFGLDNPTPVITKRLSTYGNSEEIEKMVMDVSKKYSDLQIFDPERFACIYPDKKEAKEKQFNELEGVEVIREKPAGKDMRETQVPGRVSKKVAGVHDIRLLDKLENAKKFTSPAEEVLARGI